MAAEIIIRKYVDGNLPPFGARSSATDLELADYDNVFSTRTITTGQRVDLPRDENAPLYRRLLGNAWIDLPEPVRTMHDFAAARVVEGRATVQRGTNFLSRLVGVLFGFPSAGCDVPVRVTFASKGGRELWTREFAGRPFSSLQEEGRGRFERLLCESFGPFAFGLALVVDRKKLKLIPRRWSAFGIPMPRAWVPSGEAYETADDGRFNFHVEISLPLVGLIVRYRGWLVPV
jgi:hypothetical protein